MKDSAVEATAVVAAVDEAPIVVEAGFEVVVEGLRLMALVLLPTQFRPPSLQHGMYLPSRKSLRKNPTRLRQAWMLSLLPPQTR